MPGDASIRSYARLIREDGVVILMNFPRRPDGQALYDGKSYSAAVHLAEDVKPWVAIDNGLRARGFSALHICAKLGSCVLIRSPGRRGE
jgi:aminoglycoside/choline kinase family phosphotransferase